MRRYLAHKMVAIWVEGHLELESVDILALSKPDVLFVALLRQLVEPQRLLLRIHCQGNNKAKGIILLSFLYFTDLGQQFLHHQFFLKLVDRRLVFAWFHLVGNIDDLI